MYDPNFPKIWIVFFTSGYIPNPFPKIFVSCSVVESPFLFFFYVGTNKVVHFQTILYDHWSRELFPFYLWKFSGQIFQKFSASVVSLKLRRVQIFQKFENLLCLGICEYILYNKFQKIFRSYSVAKFLFVFFGYVVNFQKILDGHGSPEFPFPFWIPPGQQFFQNWWNSVSLLQIYGPNFTTI